MWFTRALSDALRARCLRIYKGINQKLSILNKVGTLYQFNVQKINIEFVTEWTSITIKNKKKWHRDYVLNIKNIKLIKYELIGILGVVKI